MMHNMKAAQLLKERVPFDDESFAELVIWRLPQPVPGSMHSYKYRLAFIVRDECVLRYDNEAGMRRTACFVTPNVRAEAGPTAKWQARTVENAPAHFAGLPF